MKRGFKGVVSGSYDFWTQTQVVLSSVFTRCDLEDESEGGVTLEALEKASKELGFEDFLRYTNMQNMHALCCVVRH